jgi:hypothetical protein
MIVIAYICCHLSRPGKQPVSDSAVKRMRPIIGAAFVYCEDEPGRRATGKLQTRDEARRIADAYIARRARAAMRNISG